MKFPATSKSQAPTATFEEGEQHLNELLEGLMAGDVAFDHQDECPLFNIPGEIRNRIFEYVVTQQDGKDALATTDFWYRPDFTHHPYIETSLLRACRRIWVETHHLPLSQTRRRFWAGDEARAPSSKLAIQASSS
jgi:hypothetical protein